MTQRGDELGRLIEDLQASRDPSASAALAERALECFTREENPELWASLHGVLGSSLANSARSQLTLETMQRVLHCYQTVLSGRSADSEPEEWFTTWANIAQTHRDAQQRNLGDPVAQHEAVIEAYRQALLARVPAHLQNAWVEKQLQLAEALALATWRGAKAFRDSADAYALALEHLRRDEHPEPWALVNARYACVLDELQDEALVEPAIAAAEAALQILRPKTQPLWWAQAQIVLAGLYRTRKRGERQDNLERSIVAAENALTLVTAENARPLWQRIHFQRGPAYAYRQAGDESQNLTASLESLEIAGQAVPCEQYPEAWAALQVTRAYAYLKLPTGDRALHVSQSIAILKSAIAIMAPGSSHSFVRAHRLLGEAYVESQSDEAGSEEPLESAIAAFEIACDYAVEAHDAEAFSTWLNLGSAYARRSSGEPVQNLQRARVAYARALECSPDLAAWSEALRRFAICWMVDGVDAHEQRSDSRTRTPEPEMEALDPNEANDLQTVRRARALQQLATLQASLAVGEEPDLDEDFHLPQLLNDEAHQLGDSFRTFLLQGVLPNQDATTRTEIEHEHLTLTFMLLDHLTDKYAEARRTEALFEQVAAGDRGFVLYLRGFDMRMRSSSGGTLMHGAPSLKKEQLAGKLDGVALLSVRSPGESGPLTKVMRQRHPDYLALNARDFHVEAGASWRDEVRKLIQVSQFVIIDNSGDTPGVNEEVGMVAQLDRLDTTYFFDAPAADALLGLSKRCRALDERAQEHIRRALPRPPLAAATFPDAVCAWVGGARRRRLDQEVLGTQRVLDWLRAHRTAHGRNVELDALSFAAANCVILEDLDQLWPVLRAKAALLETSETLLAQRYQDAADLLRQACTMEPGPDDSVTRRAGAVLRALAAAQSSRLG